jgi:tRNA pseudouridine38-40 synthase
VSPAPESGGASEGADARTVRWRMTVAYDGSGFHGFAAQNGQHTVAGALAEALGKVLGEPVTLTCAGRTDAGVHALDQVVHFDVDEAVSARLDPVSVTKSTNSQVAPEVVVRSLARAPAGFDARRSATARRYRYLVLNAPVPDPLLRGLTWHVIDALDLRAMRAAADALLGEHDFRAFCRRPPGRGAGDPIHRRVLDAAWSRLDEGRQGRAATAAVVAPAPAVGDLYAFEIEATAFCHQMVRSIVATLVDVGRGRKRPADIPWILRAADRRHASQPAPPWGLTLVAVRYEGTGGAGGAGAGGSAGPDGLPAPSGPTYPGTPPERPPATPSGP